MNANCSVGELQTVFFFRLQREEWMQKTLGEKSKKEKKKKEYTLSPLFSLYFSFMPVDHIDTLIALLLKSVDLRDCYFILILSRTKASGLVEISR